MILPASNGRGDEWQSQRIHVTQRGTRLLSLLWFGENSTEL